MIVRQADRTWSDAELARLSQLKDELAASGELVSAEGLQAPGQGRIVQIRDGEQVVTDGPFGEAKDHMAGFVMIDVPDAARAEAIAAQAAAAVDDRVELRGTLISA